MKKLAILALLGGILGGAIASRSEGVAHAGIGDTAARIADSLERIARVLESQKLGHEHREEGCHEGK